MNRLSFVILGVLVLASAGFGVYQLDQVQKLARNAATWETERAALQKKITDLQRQNGELERRRPSSGPGTVGMTEPGDGPRNEGRPQGGPGARDGGFRVQGD